MNRNLNRKSKILLFVLLFLFLPAEAVLAANLLAEGNALFRRGQYMEAIHAYERVPAEDPEKPKAIFNAGVARYMLGDFDTAAALFAASAPLGPTFAAHYNRGNSLFRAEKFPEAAEAYKAALRMTPTDKDAKHNLLLALSQMKNDRSDSSPQNQKGDGDSSQPKPQPQGGGGGMDREMAERILQGLGDADAQTQKDMRRSRATVEMEVEKDW